MSLRRKKQFAMIGPATNTRVEVGLNMKDVAPDGAAGRQFPAGGMCQYKVRLGEAREVDAELIGLDPPGLRRGVLISLLRASDSEQATRESVYGGPGDEVPRIDYEARCMPQRRRLRKSPFREIPSSFAAFS